MKKEIEAKRVSLILKNDAIQLVNKLSNRMEDYIRIFSSQRTRNHFEQIFTCHYSNVTVKELKAMDEEFIIALNDFHILVDETKWYMFYTQDMPTQMEDFLSYKVALLNDKCEELNNLYIELYPE